MPDRPTGKAKIYDRPEHTKPSPLLIVFLLAVLCMAAYFIYRAEQRPRVAPGPASLIARSLLASKWRSQSASPGLIS